MQPWNTVLAVVGCLIFVLLPAAEAAQPEPLLTIENDYARLAFGTTGKRLSSSTALAARTIAARVRRRRWRGVKLDGKVHAATKAAIQDGHLALEFGDSGVSAVIQITAKSRYFVVEVVSVSTEKIEELAFVDLPLSPSAAAPNEPFAACALALNLKTNVRAIPRRRRTSGRPAIRGSVCRGEGGA